MTQNSNDTGLGCLIESVATVAIVLLIGILGIGALSNELNSGDSGEPVIVEDGHQEVAEAQEATAEPTEIPATSTNVPTSTPLPPTATIEPTVESVPEQGVGGAQNLDPALVSAGSNSYVAYCSACHGSDARGIVGLGKDLAMSEFIQSSTDDDLLTFVKTGRPIWDPLNTTGVDMPPKGGNPALTDDEIVAIITYIRSISIPVSSGDGATSESAEVATDATTDTAEYDPALVATGNGAFAAYCSACHGPDAKGIVGLGKDLVMSEFVSSLSDDDLIDFIKTGRPIWDPLNTTGIDMPPKGGNPALTDDDLVAIVAYVRSLR